MGIRGVPAAHGGFETFAGKLAPYLVEKGWDVRVYCQDDQQPGVKAAVREDEWSGVRRVHVPITQSGALGTLIFDLRAIWISIFQPGHVLLFGYNTAVLNVLQRLFGKKLLINMDGIEWKRPKWPPLHRLWLLLNELLGSLIGTKLIADHPEIANHLATRTPRSKIIMVPYGADQVSGADASLLDQHGLKPRKYFITICRIEPENSVMEIVQAFVSSRLDASLVILGKLDERNPYHRRIVEAAGERVKFVGAIYDKDMLAALRAFSLAYCHGHTVGGTNPSLVEALGAGCAVIAHENVFNRWVAGDGQLFFSSPQDCMARMIELSERPQRGEDARRAAHARFLDAFQWEQILATYEQLLHALTFGHEQPKAGAPISAEDRSYQ